MKMPIEPFILPKQARKGFRPISASQIFLGSLSNFWGILGKFFGKNFEILWEFLGNSLRILWEFFGNSMGILWEFF